MCVTGLCVVCVTGTTGVLRCSFLRAEPGVPSQLLPNIDAPVVRMCLVRTDVFRATQPTRLAAEIHRGRSPEAEQRIAARLAGLDRRADRVQERSLG